MTREIIELRIRSLTHYALLLIMTLVMSSCAQMGGSSSSGGGGSSLSMGQGDLDRTRKSGEYYTRLNANKNSHLPKGKPYKVRGKTYVPYTSANGFEEIGIASWYGPGFHGKLTANGEKYNQRGITAAHKLLPFGTMVRVTNLDNGRSVVVRINDRGPFLHERIIDLSEGAAKSVDMINSGTAKVHLEVAGGSSSLSGRSGGGSGRSGGGGAGSAAGAGVVGSAPLSGGLGLPPGDRNRYGQNVGDSTGGASGQGSGTPVDAYSDGSGGTDFISSDPNEFGDDPSYGGAGDTGSYGMSPDSSQVAASPMAQNQGMDTNLDPYAAGAAPIGKPTVDGNPNQGVGRSLTPTNPRGTTPNNQQYSAQDVSAYAYGGNPSASQSPAQANDMSQARSNGLGQASVQGGNANQSATRGNKEDLSVQALAPEDAGQEPVPPTQPIPPNNARQTPVQNGNTGQAPVQAENTQSPVRNSAGGEIPVQPNNVEQVPVQNADIEQIPAQNSAGGDIPVQTNNARQASPTQAVAQGNAGQAADTHYFIQVGAFKSKKNADTLVKVFRADDINSQIISARGYHFVQAGPYSTRSKADKDKNRLSSKFPEAYVINR